MIGQTISHYNILDKLGEGGMGVVYKAHDTKLDRDVALKFLPHHLTATAEEQARFLQEARAASALNHPNVCVIHDIQEHGGQQFIIMEYVDGKTLRQRVPIEKIQLAIDFAIQIGEALQEAHSRGIVHRDVKTDNIIVNSKNQIKVMDFGLAKLKGSLKLTKTSSTVGTLAYMAPEQIQGGEVDARSDIFSFGVVLYEMLTGHMPFRGEHEAAMVYSIVNEEPTPIQKYLPDVSSELVHILNRALEKDPDDRYQGVHDMVIDLRRLKKQTSRVARLTTIPESARETGEPKAKPAEGPRGRSKKWQAITLAATVVFVGIVALIVLSSGGPQINPDMRLAPLQIPFRNVYYAGASRDGNWLAFPAADDRGKFDVYVMNVSEGKPRRITYDSCASILLVSISPDVSTVLYARRRASGQPQEIVSVPFFGGKGKVVIEGATSAQWQWDGTRIDYLVRSQFGSGRITHELWSAKPDGSDRRFEFADTLQYLRTLRYSFNRSPDGKSAAWTRNYPDGSAEIIVRNLETGKELQLTHDKKVADDPRWTQNGHIIFDSNRRGNVNLWIVPSTGGEPVQLTRGSGPDVPLWVAPDCKRMYYSEIQDIGHIKLANLRDGSVRQLTVEDRLRVFPSICSTGKWIAFAAREENEYSLSMNAYVMDRQGGDIRKLTEGPEMKVLPIWSPNDKWLAYIAMRPGEPEDSAYAYLMNVENPSSPRLVGRGGVAYWLSEKDFVLWTLTASYRGAVDQPDLVELSRDSVRICPILNGKYIAAFDARAGRRGVWITSTDLYRSIGLKEARLIASGNFRIPQFARDGRDFFYLDQRTRVLHRVSLPAGKDESLDLEIPGFQNEFGVRRDGAEIVYAEYNRKTRFMIIENLFK